MNIIAWDIETCPKPVDALTEAQRTRYEKELNRKLKKNPEMDKDEASRLVRSVHPMLGWICCISAVAGDIENGPRQPKSWTTETAENEGPLLEAFWADVAEFPHGVTWVTFNGKRFDVPFLEARSMRYRLQPTRQDLLHTYPFKHRPHADLSGLWPQHYSLEELCDLLEIDTPKSELDGSQVAHAVDCGRINDVAQYCERDVVATFECVQAMPSVLTG